MKYCSQSLSFQLSSFSKKVTSFADCKDKNNKCKTQLTKEAGRLQFSVNGNPLKEEINGVIVRLNQQVEFIVESISASLELTM